MASGDIENGVMLSHSFVTDIHLKHKLENTYIQIYKSDVQHIISKSKCVAARYALIKNMWIPMFQHSERPQESSRQVYVRNAYIV